jgi:hypothetical protein
VTRTQHARITRRLQALAREVVAENPDVSDEVGAEITHARAVEEFGWETLRRWTLRGRFYDAVARWQEQHVEEDG